MKKIIAIVILVGIVATFGYFKITNMGVYAGKNVDVYETDCRQKIEGYITIARMKTSSDHTIRIVETKFFSNSKDALDYALLWETRNNLLYRSTQEAEEDLDSLSENELLNITVAVVKSENPSPYTPGVTIVNTFPIICLNGNVMNNSEKLMQ